ncbi:16S rRNA (guanine(966)-N(2))-methyltransferase RsmD [Collimonas sp. OK307]|uniref:16S rRNA (guanine(966)-N(2))-methyltransferase RsmD n=1 Tax=Collimonas sp. OK307 TaxID=1801620 RepID=UPI0008EF5B8D|nr:16S rRNA (guanine(966)-N(2))-methyltransferase RsmD [Collimonas sp. OK307]SFH90715.1 16S rRNA (guanine(966)-N(2))-methyltransferase RsmD [Collimonas sp. OK307]
MKKPSNKKPPKTPVHTFKPPLARQVRIIGGAWKRTPLAVLDSEGLRPTPDRVRETLFNWLTHLLDGNWSTVRCLDLFAGTGALGFEAASRGALEVTMIEHNTPAARQLETTKTKLDASQVRILRGDAVTWLSKARIEAGADTGRFDLIFLDPPYQQGWLEKVLPQCEGLLAEHGLLYLESEFALQEDALPSWLNGWQLLRADKAGSVFYHLLKKQGHSG